MINFKKSLNATPDSKLPNYAMRTLNPFKIVTYILFIILLSSYIARAQSPGFTQQEVILQSGITTGAQITTLSNTQKQTSRVYYDGLGRTIQAVAVQATPAQNDLIQPVAYDNLGRQTVNYLPYGGASTDETGSYRSNATTSAQAAFYNQTSQYLVKTDASPYQQKVFENSPLQRMLSAGMVGAGYQPTTATLTGGTGTQYFKTLTYRSNTSADGNILVWNPDGTFTAGTYFGPGTLSVTDGKDEAGIETQTFTDYAGRLILKREIYSPANLDTYYIYNNASMLYYIVPPKAIALMNAAAPATYSLTLTGVPSLLFVFAYDNQGRLTNKTVPGKGIMNIVYDPMNRPVLMQDANLAANYQWNYIKYDVKGRVIAQGIYTDPNHYSWTQMQSTVSGMTSYQTAWYESKNSTVGSGYYTNTIFPTTGIVGLAYAYYDNYDLTNAGSNLFSYTAAGLTNEVGATTAQLKGMPTMTLQSTVSTTATPEFLITVQFYDHNLHPVQTKTNNLLYYTNAYTVTDTKTTVPDFIGAPVVSLTVKASSSSVSTSVQTTIGYDQMHRVTTVDQSYNGAATVRVATYLYNEIGQLISKKLGSTPGATTQLQQVDFRYNIRGQLLNINNSTLTSDGGQTDDDPNPVFGMSLLYDNTDSNVGNTAYFNGKLSAVKWMSKNSSGANSYERSYKYTYDGRDRYMSANYGERVSGAVSTVHFTTNTGGWNEAVTAYDENGNIKGLTRYASTPGATSGTEIDNLTYTYSSSNANQLYTVTDPTNNINGFGIQTGGVSTGNYTYDVNGNLKADPYKALTISYNVINRTDKITFTAITGRYISYIYAADGTVLEKNQYDAGTLIAKTDYIDGFVYINGALSYFAMPEGRVLASGSTLTVEYVITDQQGNARVSFNNTGTGGTAKVVQENSYYGFGMVMPGSTVMGDNNKHLYNGGNEWQNDYTNMPDYYQTYYRNYDDELGRFIGVDPVAESAESMTSYQYAGNNPIMMNDPMGDAKRLLTPGPLGYGGGAGEFSDENMEQDAYFSFDIAAGSSDAGGGGGFETGPLEGYMDTPVNNPNSGGSSSLAGEASEDAPQSENTIINYNNGNTQFILDGSSAVLNQQADGSFDLGKPDPELYQFYAGVAATTTAVPSSTYSEIIQNVTLDEVTIASTRTGSSAGQVNIASMAFDSPLGKALIPDLVGVHVSATLVPTVGAGYSYNFDYLTRGKDSGFHMSQTLSARVGEEAGLSIAYVDGVYVGPGSVQDATYNSVMGWGADLNGAFGPVNLGTWSSINSNTLQPTWIGTSLGTGWGIGGSGGVTYSWPVK